MDLFWRFTWHLCRISTSQHLTNRPIISIFKCNISDVLTVLTNPHISIHTRKRTLECYIEPILMYWYEAWTISKQAQKKLEAVEMWFLRRMMKISCMAKKSNDTVLKETHTSRALVNKIRTRQTTFFGHVMRREKLEHLITTGMMEGKRSRGKQREKMTDGLVNWLGAGKVVEILKATRNRGIMWKDMIANAIKHGTGWWWWSRMSYTDVKYQLYKRILEKEWQVSL